MTWRWFAYLTLAPAVAVAALLMLAIGIAHLLGMSLDPVGAAIAAVGGYAVLVWSLLRHNSVR